MGSNARALAVPLQDEEEAPETREAWELLGILGNYVELGDLRLKSRTLELARRALGAQSCSEAALAGSDGGAMLKATQRYLTNERVDGLALRKALYQLSFERIEKLGLKHVVAIYDPTNLNFSKQAKTKEGLTPVGKGHVPGYVWLNFVLAELGTGRIAGVGHQTLVSAAGPDDREVVNYEWLLGEAGGQKDPAINPKQQFLAHFRMLDERAPSSIEEITAVADREFDDAFAIRGIMQKMSKRVHFVLRSDEQRVVQVRRAPWTLAERKIPSRARSLPGPHERDVVDIYLHDVGRLLPKQRFRDLPLDARGRVCLEGGKPARIAHLSIGAVPIRLARKSERGQRTGAEEQPQWLNLVVVDEPHPPEGSEPLHWALLTDWPIDTLEQKIAVADCYQGRSRIEEFFRTTNDALKLEGSKIHEPLATARMLFFVTLKLLFLDALRFAAGIFAGSPPTQKQRQSLREGAQEARRLEKLRTTKGKRPPKLSLLQRGIMLLGLIAEHGGWSNHSKTALGNYVLLRGLHAFLPVLYHGLYPWLLRDVGG
jgi:hypothetical protein